TARERISLNPESISEVQIITNQYAAEYGRASGGRINLRTRGGGNRVRGDAYGFFGDESLDANTFFRNARGLGRVPHQEMREGVVISGPIRTDRHFFLGSYERLDRPDSVEVDAPVPVRSNPAFPLPAPNRPAGPGSDVARFIDEIQTPETRNLLNGRVDLNFTQLHNASFRADAVFGGNKRGFPGGTRLPDSIAIEGRDSESASVTDNLILSARFVNQSRFQYSRLAPRRSADVNSTAIVIEDPVRIVAGVFTGSDSSPAFTRREARTQFQDTVSFLSGRHLLKSGADVQLVRATFTDLFATGGEYTFATVGDFLSNNPSRFVQRFDTQSRQANNVLGFFFQDEWKVRTNLTLSYGIRWDNESIVEDRDNFSPRLAVAWDPFGGKLSRSKGMRQPGRTVVRAGFGIFYNRALLRTIDDFSIGRSTLIVDSDLAPDVLSAVRFPSPITERSIIERFGISETAFLRRVSPDLEIPYTIQTGIGLERQISRTTVAGVDYIFTRGVHLWRETNINAPVVPQGLASLTEFLTSRDFDNRPGRDGSRPVTGANADVVRFTLGTTTSTTAGAISVVNGLRIVSLGLNAPRSSNITAALRAVNFLRPDPSLTQVEQLESTGNSFYHGMIVSVRQSLGKGLTFRATYTLSKFIDEGTTNTASPQNLLDRRAERALSLQDQRHRVTFSGTFKVPEVKIDLAPTIVVGSSRPFSIGSGVDRNLNDVLNDRPNLVQQIGRPQWRRPGDSADATVKDALALSAIGSDGNLPRNYGAGPGTSSFNLRASRTFAISEHLRVRPSIDVFNVFNSAIFSFGSEFINR
ncbi:MAG TPA: TonB-dependent receptor, partial [Blastocatellia bacterium]|nr:TonB-dependent receptor [Blastocatellia bacterium]